MLSKDKVKEIELDLTAEEEFALAMLENDEEDYVEEAGDVVNG